MNLDEFMFKHKVTGVKLAKETECSSATVHTIKNKQRSPSLLNALKLFNVVDGKVSPYEMLSKEDRKEFKEWCKRKVDDGYTL